MILGNRFLTIYVFEHTRKQEFKVSTPVNDKQQAGSYRVDWDASAYASGIYYYFIKTGEYHDVKKMILLRSNILLFHIYSFNLIR